MNMQRRYMATRMEWRPPPGFEPGLQAPQACTLPDYVTAAAVALVMLNICTVLYRFGGLG